MCDKTDKESAEKQEPTAGSSLSDLFSVDAVTQLLTEKLSFYSKNSNAEDKKVIEDLSFDGLVNHWKNGGIKKIITMAGAGISTSAGIPDFRSPGSGLYDNLQKYELPHPTAIFDINYFLDNPKPFYALAKELYPGTFKPTPCHYFIRLLEEKGLLVRHYTQNIDTLERIAGISDDKLVESHGTFFTNHCLGCRKLFSMEWMKKQIFSSVVPECDQCHGIVKPDIVFFGENLPDKFYELSDKDFKDCELLIIMGTSLEVQPFASLIDKVSSKCIRLLINREKVGQRDKFMISWSFFGSGLQYDDPDNKRDVAWIGDCDDGVYALANALEYGEELRKLVEDDHLRLDLVDSTEK